MDCKELRIVLVGKTGAGKSSTGNTILKKEAFHVSPTEDYKIRERKVEHQTLIVVDTPGLFGNRLPDYEVKKKIKDLMSHVSSGLVSPLVFLLVIQPKSFTNEDIETGKIIEGIFGKEAAHYSIVLFTREDDLKADGDKIEKIIEDNRALSEFVSHCGGRYCVFNNRAKKNTQVTKLLDMINKMVENGNGGRHGTSDRRDDNKRRAGQAESPDLISAQPNKRLQGDHDVVGADKAPKHNLTIILLGKTGAGKSSSGNAILRRKAFKTGLSASMVCEMGSEQFDGKSLAVVDTPGLLNTEVLEEQVKREVIECIKAAPGPRVFLVVIKAGRFTKEEEETVKIIQQMLGEEAAGCTMVLFTHGDNLEADEVNIEEFINQYSALHDFITQCGGGYHVFNNRSGDPAQVKELLEKINRTVNTIQTTPPADGASPVGGNKKAAKQSLRMVLVGTAGAGKSSSGNTILGRKAFKTGLPVSTVCKMESEEFDGQSLAVVDTPGLLNTEVPEEQVTREVIECIKLATPGPHVFLVVIHASRITEELETVKILQLMFGEEAADYTMALFTCGDNLEADGDTIEDRISNDKALSDFIDQCGGGYHVFNNRGNDSSQVSKLLEKINTMFHRNQERYYNNQMLEKAEKAITAKMDQLQRENPNITDEEARKQVYGGNRPTGNNKCAIQ